MHEINQHQHHPIPNPKCQTHRAHVQLASSTTLSRDSISRRLRNSTKNFSLLRYIQASKQNKDTIRKSFVKPQPNISCLPINLVDPNTGLVSCPKQIPQDVTQRLATQVNSNRGSLPLRHSYQHIRVEEALTAPPTLQVDD